MDVDYVRGKSFIQRALMVSSNAYKFNELEYVM
jgi:hypothetical protein